MDHVEKAYRRLRMLPKRRRRRYLMSLPDDVRYAVAAKIAGR